MQLIAIDLDGTLLTKDGTISAENREAILRMQEQGKIVTICSGRAPQDIDGILQEAEIQCPVISANGAVVNDGKEMIAEFSMGTEPFNEITANLIENDYYFEIYTNKGIQLFIDALEILRKEIRRLSQGDKDFPTDWAYRELDIQLSQKGLIKLPSYEHLLTGLNVYKVFVLSFDKEKLSALKEQIVANEAVSLTTSNWDKLEIAHPEANKGYGLRILADHLGIPMEETVAIGDSINDIPMFEIAGTSIAMGNANDSIKKMCTYTTKPFDENGVAFALREFVV